MPFFVDAPSSLGKLTRTEQGGARVPAVLMRSGLSTYFVAGKPVVHYTPKKVVREAAEKFRDATVTYNHPPKKEVDPSNYKTEARGHVSGLPTYNDGGPTAQAVLEGELVINDFELLDAIDIGAARQVSPGYDLGVFYTPGIVDEPGPDFGKSYDVLRAAITRGNHIAVLKSGRQGETVRLMLDSATGDSILPEKETPVMKLVIDSKEVAPEAVQGVVDGLLATRDALKTENVSLKAQLAEATDAKKFTDAVEAAATLKFEKRVADEKAAADKVEADKKLVALRTNAAKAYPKLVVDGKEYSAEYLQALVDAAPTDDDGLTAMRGGVKGTEVKLETKKETATDAADEEVSPQEAARRHNQNAWLLPIPGAATKSA